MIPELPRIPAVDAGLLDAYARAHGLLEGARQDADPQLDLVFRRFAIETSCEAIAGIPPTFRTGALPPLLPAPRAFLSARDLARIDGIRAGVQYLDSRLAMVAQGHDAVSLRSESPFVLHALAEGRVDNPQVTNPGMIRATEVQQAAGMFTFPPPVEVRALFEDAVNIAISAPGPACARAAWLMYATIFIHPFCDGNGRVARLLYLLVAGAELPAGVDWGVAEQWSARREAFTYSGPCHALDAALDLTPLVAFVTRASADGAALMRKRLEVLEELRRGYARRVPEAQDVLAAVTLTRRRVATADVIAADLGQPYAETLDQLRALDAVGLLRRVPSPPSRRRAGPSRPAFALSAEATAVATSVVTRATLTATD